MEFYLSHFIYPIVTVSIIYFAILFPTYLILKKYKPSYWWMMTLSITEIFLVNGMLYYLMIRSGYGYAYIDMFMFSFFATLIFFIFIPLMSKKFLKDKVRLSLIMSYVILFIIQISYGIFLAYLIAWGAGQISKILG